MTDNQIIWRNIDVSACVVMILIIVYLTVGLPITLAFTCLGQFKTVNCSITSNAITPTGINYYTLSYSNKYVVSHDNKYFNQSFTKCEFDGQTLAINSDDRLNNKTCQISLFIGLFAPVFGCAAIFILIFIYVVNNFARFVDFLSEKLSDRLCCRIICCLDSKVEFIGEETI